MVFGIRTKVPNLANTLNVDVGTPISADRFRLYKDFIVQRNCVGVPTFESIGFLGLYFRLL